MKIKKNCHKIILFCFYSIWLLTISKVNDDKIQNEPLFLTIRWSLIYEKTYQLRNIIMIRELYLLLYHISLARFTMHNFESFDKKFLKFIRPSPNTTYILSNTKASLQTTHRITSWLSHLKDHKFKLSWKAESKFWIRY